MYDPRVRPGRSRRSLGGTASGTSRVPRVGDGRSPRRGACGAPGMRTRRTARRRRAAACFALPLLRRPFSTPGPPLRGRRRRAGRHTARLASLQYRRRSHYKSNPCPTGRRCHPPERAGHGRQLWIRARALQRSEELVRLNFALQSSLAAPYPTGLALASATGWLRRTISSGSSTVSAKRRSKPASALPGPVTATIRTP